MFEDYRASKDDFAAIEEALNSAAHPKMRFIFSDFLRIIKTLIVSYDSKYIYVWRLNPIKLASKVPHDFTIPDEWQSGWWAGFVSKQIKKYLPKDKREQLISGGLLTPFITLQEAKKVSLNPYTTKESYTATIIHELGHIYWNSHKLWWPSSKDRNLDFLNLAVKLYSSEQKLPKNFSFPIPSPIYLSEVFAFCAEYYASEIFWKDHKNNLDIFTINRIKKLITIENERNLDKENSVIEPTTSPHDFSSVLGKIVLIKYPKSWPEILTKFIFV